MSPEAKVPKLDVQDLEIVAVLQNECRFYLRDVEYEDGTGEVLAQEISNEAQKRNIPVRKMIGFGSDGANVMNGEGKGVNGRLKEQNAHLVSLVKIFFMAHLFTLMTQTFYKWPITFHYGRP